MNRLKKLILLAICAGTAQAQAELYTLLIYETPQSYQMRADTKKMNDYWEAFSNYTGLLQKDGVLRGGSAFKNDNVQHVNALKKSVTTKSGTYERSSLVLGGYLTIDVPDMQTAVKYAQKVPSGSLVEIRAPQENPLMSMSK